MIIVSGSIPEYPIMIRGKLFYEKLNQEYSIVSVCRADLIKAGLREERVINISDFEIKSIATEMSNYFCATDSYWVALKEALNKLNIKK